MSVIWLVEWDLRGDGKSSDRRRFYRELDKLIKKSEGLLERSTQSVLKTQNEELARLIYELASQFGKAYMWKAQQVR